MATTERCRYCDRGTRIEHSYDYEGTTHDDSYCNRCGKRWRAAPPPDPPPPREVRLPDVDVDD
jgi:hypothetical protein